MNETTMDHEARALAAVYRLLLQKAAERRARLATTTTAKNKGEAKQEEKETKNAPK